MKADVDVRTLLANERAIDIARTFHEYYSEIPWDKYLEDAMHNAYVVCRPSCFAIARVVTIEKRPGQWGWFIELAVGDMLELIACLPGRLDFVAFRRNYEGKVRDYDLEKIIKKALKLKRG